MVGEIPGQADLAMPQCQHAGADRAMAKGPQQVAGNNAADEDDDQVEDGVVIARRPGRAGRGGGWHRQPRHRWEMTGAAACATTGRAKGSGRVYMADGWTRGRILFLLDEAARLGRMKTLETARDIGRKYGVSLHMLFQSVGQMAEAWGREGTRAWIDAAAWVGYAAIRAGGAGKDLSDQLGAHGVLAWSEGDNQGRQKPFGLNFGSTSRGINVNVHEIRRSLIAASEMQQDLREDEIIIVPAAGLPLRIGRAIYFRRPEMMAQVTVLRGWCAQTR